MINWTEKLLKARDFNRQAYDLIGQKRKYTNLPYWTHCEEVVDIISKFTNDENILIATLSHDLKEEVSPLNSIYSDDFIRANIGEKAFNLMIELTDVFTHEAFPNKNRAERKRLERELEKDNSKEAKMIRLADILSNSSSIISNDKKFSTTYLPEIYLLLFNIRDGNEELYQRAMKQVLMGFEEFQLDIPARQ